MNRSNKKTHLLSLIALGLLPTLFDLVALFLHVQGKLGNTLYFTIWENYLFINIPTAIALLWILLLPVKKKYKAIGCIVATVLLWFNLDFLYGLYGP